MWRLTCQFIARINRCKSMYKNINLNADISVNFSVRAFLLCLLVFSKLTFAQASADNVTAQTPPKIVTTENTESPLIVETTVDSTVATSQKTSQNLSPTIAATQENKVPVVGKHVGGNMDAMTMIVSLFLVLIMVIAFAFITKRFQPARLNNQGISLVTSMALSAKERIIVIQVGDKQQLLGVTAQQITLLDTLDEPLEINKPLAAELGQSFMGLLQKQFKKPS